MVNAGPISQRPDLCDSCGCLQDALDAFCAKNSAFPHARFIGESGNKKWRCFKSLRTDQQTAKQCISDKKRLINCVAPRRHSPNKMFQNNALRIINQFQGCEEDPTIEATTFAPDTGATAEPGTGATAEPAGPLVNCDDGKCLIPEGTNCRGNIFTDGQNKIVGGTEAVEHSWNWIVHFEDIGCGASLINNNWIVTAAHCCSPDLVGQKVLAGIHYWNWGYHHTEGSQQATITEVHLHPSYGTSKSAFDICMVKVDSFNMDGDYVNMACLPEQGEKVPVGQMCYTGGWGALGSNANLATKLQSVNVEIYDDEVCHSVQSYGDEFVPEYEVCAGRLAGGKDSCQGDSGGPLVCVVNGEPVLVGVVSWGYGCASYGFPGVYAETAKFINWMEDVIADEEDTVLDTTTEATTTTASDTEGADEEDNAGS